MGTSGYHQYPVRSVNGVARDADGNVFLTPADIGAAGVASGVEDALAITANGQTAFTMSAAEAHPGNLIVHVGGAYVPTSHYTVAGTALTYTGSLPLQNGDTLYVRHAFNL